MKMRLIWLLCTALVVVAAQARSAEVVSGQRDYTAAVQAFADAVLEHGRDDYGNKNTPLFVDGLQAETLEPARWKKDGETWVMCNFASQQPLLRTLDGLTSLTGRKKYRRAAEDAARYAMSHLQSSNGLLYWGGHLAWDLQQERPVGQYRGTHELKGHQPYYRLMWRVDPAATSRLLQAVWAAHILDWATLDYNRHADTEKPCSFQWNAEFDDDLQVPFPTEGSNLSFANVTPPLLHAGVMLAVLEDKPAALTWSRRLVERWQQGKHPQTGLCGGQLSYRQHDRAQDALGHVHPTINEAQIVASYHQTCRYHTLPLVQLQAAQSLQEEGGPSSAVAREWVQWAVEDLKTYARHSFDADTGKFVALMTDGTPLKWRESKEGYYVPSSFAPRGADGNIFWSYALAFRVTQDRELWRMVRALARELQLGDLGDPDGRGSNLRLDTDQSDWRVIYALLQLHRATRTDRLLQVAASVADNILARQSDSGLFPRPGREYARTGDEAPLAILHLAAALQGKQSAMPPAVYDSRFFHCEFHGPLEKHQEKRSDRRTYDSLVFYGE